MNWPDLVYAWRQDSPAKQSNEMARGHLDRVDQQQRMQELQYYLHMLYTPGENHVLQVRDVQGPEDYGLMLVSINFLRKYKARIRSVGLEAHSLRTLADQHIDVVRKTLTLRPEFSELRNNEQRDNIVKLVCRELYDLKSRLEEIEHYATEVGKEYNDTYNQLSLTYNVVNAMSYYRGLYGQPGGPTKNTTSRG